jgi:hypothetical protein
MALRRTFMGDKVKPRGRLLSQYASYSTSELDLRVVGVSSLQPFCSERTLCS